MTWPDAPPVGLMHPLLLAVQAAASRACSAHLTRDGQGRNLVAHQFFNCLQEAAPLLEGARTFASTVELGSPGDDCYFHRIPARHLDPAVATGRVNISIIAVVSGGACRAPKELAFTAGEAIRDYFVHGMAPRCAVISDCTLDTASKHQDIFMPGVTVAAPLVRHHRRLARSVAPDLPILLLAWHQN